jgi:hypothetical protein
MFAQQQNLPRRTAHNMLGFDATELSLCQKLNVPTPCLGGPIGSARINCDRLTKVLHHLLFHKQKTVNTFGRA